MKLGWNEVKDEFAGIKWYDRKTVRDETSLTPEEVKYIKSWTIAPFGYGNIFYICKRVMPDILTVYIITFIYFQAYEPFIQPF